jgi:hypothetical protein
MTAAKAKEVCDALIDAGYDPRVETQPDGSKLVKTSTQTLDAGTIQNFATAHSVANLVKGEVVFS